MNTWNRLALSSLGFAVLVIGAVPGRAAPLEPAGCDQLKQELHTLEKAGVRANFDKGAAWAKTNLKPSEISEVERLIDTEAQFLFRCPQPKRKYDPATEAVMENGTGSDPDPDAPKPDATVKPAPAPGVKQAPPAAKPKPKPPAAATAAPATDTGETPAPKPKRAAAKPKPADAFNPETAAKPAAPATTVPQ